MSEFKNYIKVVPQPMRPYVAGEVLGPEVSISPEDRAAGSPKVGDMIAVSPKSSNDKWLVAAKFFADNYRAL